MSVSSRPAFGSGKRVLGALAAGALLVPASPFISSAFAADAAPTTRNTDTACPPSQVQSAGYNDISGNTFELAINCISKYGVAQGTTSTTYSPSQSVTRAQMAVFIYRIGQKAGLTFDTSDAGFTDVGDQGTEFKNAINGLAHAGVVNGTTSTTYAPHAAVARDQMASFINRLQKAIAGSGFSTTNDYFSDDSDSVHQADINAIASVGITGGTAAGSDKYEPHAFVSRGQMAGFLSRFIDIEVVAGKITNAYTTPVNSATTLPELRSASVISTTTTAQAAANPGTPAGTVVRYTFDEAVNFVAPTATDFKVYDLTDTNRSGAATLVKYSGNTVDINFSGVTNAQGATQSSDLTLATVVAGAVNDQQGQQNPIGDAALGTAQAAGGGTSLAAGVTTAPDLSSVGNFRAGTDTAGAANDTTVVDFTFDQNATTTTVGAGAGGFNLVLPNGTVVPGTGPAGGGATAGGGTVAGGNGTTRVTVSFPDQTAGKSLTAADVARGYVGAGTVKGTDTTAASNVLQAAAVSSGTITPDLVSAAFQPATDGTSSDKVLYTFDQAVTQTTAQTGAAAGDFQIYYGDASVLPSAATSTATVNPSDGRQVLVTFDNGKLAGAVGASVKAGAVTATSGVANVSDADEVGVAGKAGSTGARTPGLTTGPDLTGVKVSTSKDQFGNTTGYTATYTFDEDVNATTVPTSANFSLYLADGTQLTGSGTAVLSTSTTAGSKNTVTINSFTTTAGTATSAQIGSATLGTVAAAAVTDTGTVGQTNPEGAEFTTGGTGTPAS